MPPKVDTSPSNEASEPLSKVVYVGHLPEGFYEKQLLGYFSQFGTLKRVRVSRNKKTGKAKHYAFLEFEHPEVAQIVADAMDGYFLLTQRLVCKVVKPESIHPELFKGANKKFHNIPWRKLERERHNKEITAKEYARRAARAVKRDLKRQHRIEKSGIEYCYAGLATLVPAKPKKTKFE